MPGKLDRISVALAVLGILISLYLTYAHYADVPVACPATGILDCGLVLSSPYASLLGVPLAALGLLFFIIYLALLLMKRHEDVLLWNGLGIGFVLYFLYLEYLLAHICIYCTAVHIITVLLLAIAIYRYRLGGAAVR